MKRMFITLALTILTLHTAGAEEKTRSYDFGDITSISAGSNFQIHVTEGRSGTVKAVYDDGIEEYMDFDVRYHAGTLSLVLEQKKQLKRWSDPKPVHVYLEMDKIHKISLSGAAKATFTGSFKADDFNLSISGASTLHSLEITGQSMEADITGAANGNVKGRFAKEIELDLSGASKMKLEADSEILEGEFSGASKFSCTGEFRTVSMDCSGASSAVIAGKGGNATFECTGASAIDAGEFHVKTATVELTGASKAKVNASDEIHYDVSRASKMTYYGDAKLFNHNEDTNIVKGR